MLCFQQQCFCLLHFLLLDKIRQRPACLLFEFRSQSAAAFAAVCCDVCGADRFCHMTADILQHISHQSGLAAAALFQILLFTAIQAHAPTGQTGRFMSLITVCACLTQPVGQAACGLLYGLFAALPSAVLFAAAVASIFINLAASNIFKKSVSFTKS